MRALLLGLVFIAGACEAALDPVQSQKMRAAAEELLQQQTAGLPGRVSFTIGPIDERLNLPRCTDVEAFVPPGTRLWGASNVGVRCTAGAVWTVYLSVTVHVSAEVVTAARPLAQNEPLQLTDIALQEADLTQLPGAVITDSRLALGRMPLRSIPAGQPLRQDLLRSPPVVQAGQSVTLVSQGAGFKVSAEGKALGAAAEGQVAQVRTPSGRTVSGIARAGGMVEVP